MIVKLQGRLSDHYFDLSKLISIVEKRADAEFKPCGWQDGMAALLNFQSGSCWPVVNWSTTDEWAQFKKLVDDTGEFFPWLESQVKP